MADTGKTNGDLVAPIQEKEREPKTEPSNNDRRHLSDQEPPPLPTPSLERGAASLSLRQARADAWALQPRSGPTDAALRGAGSPTGLGSHSSGERREDARP